MRPALTFLATIVIALGLASTAAAAPCKDAAGKFTKCPAAAATAGYSLDAKGNCHDAKGKMAKKSLCAAAAPAASAAAAPAAATTSTTTKSTTTKSMAAASADGPKCTKGKRCGNACISVKDVCHK